MTETKHVPTHLERLEATLAKVQSGELVMSDDDGPTGEEINPIKWIADGATTLSEVAKALRDEADWFEKMERAGWQAVEVVEGGQVVMAHPTETSTGRWVPVEPEASPTT